MESSETPTSQPTSQEASSAQSEIEKNVRRKTDIAWGHCKQIPETNILVCNYCGKKFGGGGIHRVKEHLAWIPGNVESCKKVPAEIRFQMKENFDERSKKKRKASAVAEIDSAIAEEDEQVQTNPTLPTTSKKGKNVGRIGTYFLPRTTPGAQPTLKSVIQSKEAVEKCDLAIAKWFIDASIPFNAANSPYFQPAADALCSVGAGYKVPTMHAFRGNLLN
ncbi:hypothetical protein A2U01_0017574, partial [Trifolium medium]|nr:hypothetical protein [Trifolium medium]